MEDNKEEEDDIKDKKEEDKERDNYNYKDDEGDETKRGLLCVYASALGFHVWQGAQTS